MSNIIYKIQHIPSKKFVRIKLTKLGVDVWVAKDVINGNPDFGKVLFNTSNGWKTPPEPSNEYFKKIDCKIVKYIVKQKQLI